jgi:hypothetical protein
MEILPFYPVRAYCNRTWFQTDVWEDCKISGCNKCGMDSEKCPEGMPLCTDTLSNNIPGVCCSSDEIKCCRDDVCLNRCMRGNTEFDCDCTEVCDEPRSYQCSVGQCNHHVIMDVKVDVILPLTDPVTTLGGFRYIKECHDHGCIQLHEYYIPTESCWVSPTHLRFTKDANEASTSVLEAPLTNRTYIFKTKDLVLAFVISGLNITHTDDVRGLTSAMNSDSSMEWDHMTDSEVVEWTFKHKQELDPTIAQNVISHAVLLSQEKTSIYTSCVLKSIDLNVYSLQNNTEIDKSIQNMVINMTKLAIGAFYTNHNDEICSDSDSYSNSKIIFGFAIVVLYLIVLIYFLYEYRHKYCDKTQPQEPAIVPNPVELDNILMTRVPSPEPNPKFITREELPPLWSCSICLGDKNNSRHSRLQFKNIFSLKCGHIFHQKCIIDWNNLNKDCPLCRRDIGIV